MLSQNQVLSEIMEGSTNLIESPDSAIHTPAINPVMYDLAVACAKSKRTTLIQMRHDDSEAHRWVNKSIEAARNITETELGAIVANLQIVSIPSSTEVPWNDEVKNVLEHITDRLSECVLFSGVPGDNEHVSVQDVISRIKAHAGQCTYFYQTLEPLSSDHVPDDVDSVFTYKQRNEHGTSFVIINPKTKAVRREVFFKSNK